MNIKSTHGLRTSAAVSQPQRSGQSKHQVRGKRVEAKKRAHDFPPTPVVKSTSAEQDKRRPYQAGRTKLQPIPVQPAGNHAPASIRDSAFVPPVGYALVDDDFYEIGTRDVVFVGGRHPYWMAARRAGEIGSLLRFSTATAVARLLA